MQLFWLGLGTKIFAVLSSGRETRKISDPVTSQARGGNSDEIRCQGQEGVWLIALDPLANADGQFQCSRKLSHGCIGEGCQ